MVPGERREHNRTMKDSRLDSPAAQPPLSPLVARIQMAAFRTGRPLGWYPRSRPLPRLPTGLLLGGRPAWRNLLTLNIAACEAERAEEENAAAGEMSTQQLREEIALERVRVQAELDRLGDESSCPSCLYTGVGTCLGLASYFGYLGMEEAHVQPVTLNVRQRQAFFGIMAVGWISIGAYRYHLG
jgi:hypothetical protein